MERNYNNLSLVEWQKICNRLNYNIVANDDMASIIMSFYATNHKNECVATWSTEYDAWVKF